jgi:hypothetical protein
LSITPLNGWIWRQQMPAGLGLILRYVASLLV